MKILVINTGSSSIKYQLFDMDRDQALATGTVEKIGESTSIMTHSFSRQVSAKTRHISVSSLARV